MTSEIEKLREELQCALRLLERLGEASPPSKETTASEGRLREEVEELKHRLKQERMQNETNARNFEELQGIR